MAVLAYYAYYEIAKSSLPWYRQNVPKQDGGECLGGLEISNFREFRVPPEQPPKTEKLGTLEYFGVNQAIVV